MPLDDQTRRKRRIRRVVVYGLLLGAFWGFWVWQPWEIDIIERRGPLPNPMVDPHVEKLFSKGTRVLVVTAHPDDSEFYIGGTLAKLRDSGAEMRQVILTDGDKAYYGPLTNAAENRVVRREEALAAARSWGAKDLIILGYPDGRLKVDSKLVARLRLEIEEFKPDYVLASDFEFPPRFSHRDHRRSGEAVALALVEPSSAKWLLRFSTAHPNYVVDMTEYWPEKMEMLKVHKSQFHGDRLVGITNMVENRSIEDGEIIGASYGEGFRATQLVAD
jgi:LmbE family N-acetylglucosaminyl deacetylase